MRRQEDQVARVALLRHFIEALQRVDLTVPERIFGLVVGLGQHEREIGLAQDRGAEHLVAGRDTLRRQRQYVVLDDRQQALGQFGLIHVCSLPRIAAGI